LVQLPRVASLGRSTLDNGLALYLNAPRLETESARAGHKTTIGTPARPAPSFLGSDVAAKIAMIDWLSQPHETMAGCTRAVAAESPAAAHPS
jgi:hypothetical protein